MAEKPNYETMTPAELHMFKQLIALEIKKLKRKPFALHTKAREQQRREEE